VQKRVKQKLQTVAVQEGLRYVERNPQENIPKLMKWLRTFARIPEHREIIDNGLETWDRTDRGWRPLIERSFEQLSPNVRRKFLVNFVVNAILHGTPAGHELIDAYDINVPWAILMDPTSNCNFNCTGCWAQQYEKQADLSFETMDRIISEGKELGIYMYLYSGGEPLLRAEDLTALAEKHDDCMFCAFTNASLVDHALAEKWAELGNFTLAISMEGFEEETDLRRGQGSARRMLDAMDILRQHGVGFGFSTCYHRNNTETVVSEEFVDFMVAKGAIFGWYFTYIPLGRHADTDLLATPEQRQLVKERIDQYSTEKDLFLIDFWNDGERVGGCIAGGRRYFHINAHGDVEPCAFIHYSDRNIHECSLWEALHSPLFKQYRKHQPFNNNHLLPCPMLDNPDLLVKMVEEAGAKSTQQGDKESPQVLAEKCQEAAKRWRPVAEQIWAEEHEQEPAVRK